MKFVCGKCGTKYSLSDERVAGKVLKIRCKSCGDIIEVSGSRAPAAAAGKAPAGPVQGDPGLADRFASSWKPGPPGGTGGTPGLFQSVQRSAAGIEKDGTRIASWFVAVDDKPVGPVAAAGIHRYRRAGKVDDGSLVWKEGLPDWLPLRDCKELVGLLAGLELAAAAPGDGSTTKSEAVAKPPPRTGPLAGAAAPATASPLRGQHLGRLDGDPAPPGSLPPTPAGAAPDGIAARPAPLAPAKPSSAEREFFGGLPEEDGTGDDRLSSLRSISPPRVAGQNRLITLAAVGFLGVAVAVLGVAVVTSGNAETRVITEVVEKVVEKERIVYRDSPPAEVEEDQAPGDEPVGKDAVTRPRGGQASGGKGRAAESADDKKKRLLEEMGLAASSGNQKLVGGGGEPSAAASASSSASSSGKGSGSTALTGDQIRKTYNNNRNSMQLCYERSLKQGEVPEDKSVKAETRIVVGGSGMVKTVTVAGQAAGYPALKSCIERAVRKWVFPASSGDSPVEIPTLFTPK